MYLRLFITESDICDAVDLRFGLKVIVDCNNDVSDGACGAGVIEFVTVCSVDLFSDEDGVI
ncbi:unnamed protein product, partial [Rotaria sp. Silwood1]